MPYISKQARTALTWPGCRPSIPGELNYALTSVINQYVQDRGKSYAILNDVIGALESAKLEFYRRVVAPYEDQKCAQNGDVFT